MRATIALAALLAALTSAEAGDYRANDVRPWAAYVEAKESMRPGEVTTPDQAINHMLARLGPLPWRFDAGPTTPFTSRAVVNRLFTKTEYQTRYGETVARVEVKYPEVTQGLVGENLFLFVSFNNVSPRYDGSKCTYALSPYGGRC